MIDILGYVLKILTLLGITVEIIPVKFSPLKWLGDRLNGSIKEQLIDLRATVDHNDIDTIRHRIASFENLCRLDNSHTEIKRHQYIAAFKDIDKWNKYHEKYKDLNGELKLAIQNIEDAYKKAKFND